MINFAIEKPITIKQAAAIAEVVPATVWRWIKSGKLEARQGGRGWRTTREAINRFFGGDEAAGSLADPEPEPDAPAGFAEAMSELADLGIFKNGGHQGWQPKKQQASRNSPA